MVLKNQKILFFLAFIALVIALFTKINIPDLSKAADIYVDIILTFLIFALLITFVFKGKFRL